MWWIGYQICKQPQPPPGSLKLQVVRAEVSLLIQLLFTKTWIFIGCGLMLWWVQCTKVLKQRCVTSIGNIDKAMWVFNCLGRPGRLVKISRIHFFHFVLNECLYKCKHVRQIDIIRVYLAWNCLWARYVIDNLIIEEFQKW